ncbi:hypothetical protein NEOLEDRAFT_810075 [Neolentinus lepideus HHB14362 ss-1]|uniref:Uncharacterized protein n=1 Tax=Neolentinus lepideus HHB14362 ss-1 TaxID=1314782 RepID=A0A165PGW1_9AGAM|nr:hypothetical protein NEOLEDRAFT_810075 [Neolentinus lepideus HHB14362 ss-1]
MSAFFNTLDPPDKTTPLVHSKRNLPLPCYSAWTLFVTDISLWLSLARHCYSHPINWALETGASAVRRALKPVRAAGVLSSHISQRICRSHPLCADVRPKRTRDMPYSRAEHTDTQLVRSESHISRTIA